jgi:hypothetical protein
MPKRTGARTNAVAMLAVALTSATLTNYRLEPTTVVDGLHELAQAINNLAEAIRAQNHNGKAAPGVAILGGEG